MENADKVISEEFKSRILDYRTKHAGQQRYKWPQAMRSEILNLHASGVSLKAISAETGISQTLMQKWVKKKAKQAALAAKKKNADFLELKIVAADKDSSVDNFFVRLAGAEIVGFKTSESLVKFLREARILL